MEPFNALWLEQNGCHFAKDNFQRMFFNENVWQYPSIGSDNGLAPVNQQAIIWIDDGLVHWRIYASLTLNELIKINTTSHR